MIPPENQAGTASSSVRRNSPKKRNSKGIEVAGEALSNTAMPQMPQSLDAEKGLLSSILLSPREVLLECADKIGESSFYSPAHGIIFRVLQEMFGANQEIDIITLTSRLGSLGLLDSVGGPGVVTELSGFVPTSANAQYYWEIIHEKHLLRTMIMTCTESVRRCYEEQENVPGLLDDVEKEVLAVASGRIKENEKGMREHVDQVLANMDKMFEQKGRISGLATGFGVLDKMTDGLHGGEMIIVAARPSMGKTAFAMNIVEHVALESGEPRPVGVFSLEMSTSQLVQRLLCSRARVNMEEVRSGMLPRSKHGQINDAAEELAGAPIYIDDTPSLSITDLRTRARRMKDRYDVQMIAIDYLQLCRSPSKRGQENRQQEVAEISTGIKALAKELDIPIIVLAQLNRQPDARGGGKPRMSDLRESGSLEQDADLVGLLVRPEVYETDEETRKELRGQAELIIAKQRNGPIGEVPLTFLKEYTRFETRAFERSEGYGEE